MNPMCYKLESKWNLKNHYLGKIVEKSVLREKGDFWEKEEKYEIIFRVQLFFGNKSQQSITNFSSSIQSTAELEVSEKQPVPTQVNPGEQIIQIFNIQCNKVNYWKYFLERKKHLFFFWLDSKIDKIEVLFLIVVKILAF